MFPVIESSRIGRVYFSPTPGAEGGGIDRVSPASNSNVNPLQAVFDQTIQHLRTSVFKDAGLPSYGAKEQITTLESLLKARNHSELVRQVEAIVTNESLSDVREPDKKLALYFIARLASVISHNNVGDHREAGTQIRELMSLGYQSMVPELARSLTQGLSALATTQAKPAIEAVTTTSYADTLNQSASVSAPQTVTLTSNKSFASSALTGPQHIPAEITTPLTGKAITDRSNQFHLDWFARSVQASPDKDVVLGNTMHEALSALALFGAKGKTQDHLFRFLRLGSSSPTPAEIKAIAEAYRQSVNVIPALKANGQFDYTSAAGLFINSQWIDHISREFENQYSRAFGSEVYELTTAKFQEWAKKKTRNLLEPNIQISPNDVLTLATANVFQSQLLHPFTGSETDTFRTASGKDVNFPIMHQNSELNFAEKIIGDQIVKIAQLPYKTGENIRYVAYVILPENLQAFSKHLDAKTLNDLTQGMRIHKVDLRLPRFESVTSQDAKTVLAGAEEMQLPLSGNLADYQDLIAPQSRALVGGLHLGQVNHDAKVRQTETQTQAASISSVRVTRKSIDMNPIGELHATLPFIFLITDPHSENVSKDNSLGRILFTAAINDPTAIPESDLKDQDQINSGKKNIIIPRKQSTSTPRSGLQSGFPDLSRRFFDTTQ